MEATYVVIKKAHGPSGIYREVMTNPASFESAKAECDGMNWMEMTDAIIEFYVEPAAIAEYRK